MGSQTGQDTAAEFGMPFVEVSAMTGANVREAFMFATTRAVAEHLARDRFLQSRGRVGRSKSVERTMQRVPGLQVRVCVREREEEQRWYLMCMHTSTSASRW